MTRLNRSATVFSMSLAAAAAFALPAAGAVVLAVEDFDGTGPAWGNDIASQLFEDPSSSGEGLFIQENSGTTGSFSGNSLFARDLQGEGDEPSLSPFEFTFEAIDTTGFTNLNLSWNIAARTINDSATFEVFLNEESQGLETLYGDTEGATVVSNLSIGFSSSVPVETFSLVFQGTLNSSADFFEIDNITLSGDVIPEPASAALLAAGGVALLARRRRRA